MGKAVKIFVQRKDETNTIENFHMKNNIDWWGERYRGRWHYCSKLSLYSNKSSTQERPMRNIEKQCKLFSMFQKAAISDLLNFWTVALRISIASASLRFKSSNVKHPYSIFFFWILVRRGKMKAKRITYNLAISKIPRNWRITLQSFNTWVKICMS